MMVVVAFAGSYCCAEGKRKGIAFIPWLDAVVIWLMEGCMQSIRTWYTWACWKTGYFARPSQFGCSVHVCYVLIRVKRRLKTSGGELCCWRREQTATEGREGYYFCENLGRTKGIQVVTSRLCFVLLPHPRSLSFRMLLLCWSLFDARITIIIIVNMERCFSFSFLGAATALPSSSSSHLYYLCTEERKAGRLVKQTTNKIHC